MVEHVVECLRPLTRALRFEREPVVTATPTMWHLSTRIEGTLRDRAISSLRLAVALHPTPAVCGVPTRDARVRVKGTVTPGLNVGGRSFGTAIRARDMDIRY